MPNEKQTQCCKKEKKNIYIQKIDLRHAETPSFQPTANYINNKKKNPIE